MNKFTYWLGEIADWYCAIVSAIVTYFIWMILIFGGKFDIEINWHSSVELLHKIIGD
jgi:hypothetical protein